MTRTLLLAASLGLSLIAFAASAQAPARPAPVAASAAFDVIRQTVAPSLYEVAYSPRQKAVYVASSGAAGAAPLPSKVLKLDAATLAVKGQITVEPRAFGMTLDDAAGRLYLSNSSDASVTVVDTATDKVIGLIQLGQKTKNAKGEDAYNHHVRELAVDAKNNRLFAPGLAVEGSSVLFVADTRTNKIEKTIEGLGYVAAGLALDEAAGRVYVSNLQGQVFVYDTKTLALLHTWDVGAGQALNLALDKARGHLFVVDQGHPRIVDMRKKTAPDYQDNGLGSRVVVVDVRTGKAIASFDTGSLPIAPLFDGQRNRLFVTNRGEGSVSVFDAVTYKPLQTVALPDHPNSLSLDPATGGVFVTVKNGEKAPRGSDESVARIVLK